MITFMYWFSGLHPVLVPIVDNAGTNFGEERQTNCIMA